MWMGVLCAVALSLVGCEESFDPFDESDVTFSLFGYFDVAADTQFVRVGELQQSAFDDQGSTASVVLEDLEGGEQIVLRDSVFRFPNGAFATNFWTPEPIRPNAAYRLTASKPGGVEARAAFRTPDMIPIPELESGLSPFSSEDNPPTAQSLTIRGAEKLADVRVVYRLSDPNTTLTIQYLDRIVETANGDLTLSFSAYKDVQRVLSGAEGVGCPGLRGASVSIAVANEDWPDFMALDIESLALPNAISNVDNGLGYVGGVLTMGTEWPNLVGVFGLNRAACQG